MAPPPLLNYQYQFRDNGVLMNADAQTPPWIDVSTISGLDAGFVRISTRERESVDGSYIDASHMSSRTITLEGILFANTNDPDTVLDQLRMNYGPTAVDYPFYFQHPNRPLRMCIGRGGGFKYQIDTTRRLGQTPYQAIVLCSTPFIYDAIPYVTTVGPIPAIQQSQINANATFEGGLGVTNWTGGNGAVLTQSTAVVHSGQDSMLMTPNGTSVNPNAISEQDAVIQGNAYTANVWVNSPQGWASGVTVFFAWYNSGGTQIGSSAFAPTATLTANTWTNLVFTAYAAPAGTAKATVTLWVIGTPPATTLFNWDDVFLYQNPGFAFPAGPFNVGFGGIGGTPLLFLNAYGAVTTNNGTHSSYPIFTLTGPLTNPQVLDSQHGVLMNFNITLGSSDVLVVDNFSRSITLNGTVSRRNVLQGLYWATVDPQSNNTFTLFSQAGNGTLQVLNYSTYF